LPDPQWIEKVAAFVVPKPGTTIDPKAVIAHCKANLAGYKVPKQVEIVNEIPKTATGKVRKNVIREMCASK
jgi:acyl-CoA synthetase (AMP-forming)/AMP-acid ligase II